MQRHQCIPTGKAAYEACAAKAPPILAADRKVQGVLRLPIKRSLCFRNLSWPAGSISVWVAGIFSCLHLLGKRLPSLSLLDLHVAYSQ